MKIKILTLILLCLLLCGCVQGGNTTDPVDTTAWLNMNENYPISDALPDGRGQTVKVILLLGQSNATGCSLTSYLQQSVDAETYAAFEAGFPSVQINFNLDDHKYTSCGEFIPTGLNCAAGEGCFGPEVGMAEVLSQAFPAETVFLLKYSMSGYSLHHHWLCDGQRGSIYEAFMSFAETYLEYLRSKNYDPRVGAVCWMQGESDTTDFKASRYYDNQMAFAAYLREDLKDYEAEGGIYFIDAGISDSPYCLPAYPAINDAKLRFSEASSLNLYFPTIEAGFTTLYEPESNPDLGHYDALWELELGRQFGRYVVESYQMRAKSGN